MKNAKNKLSLIDQVIERVEKHNDMCGVILDDYIVDKDCITEIAAADDNLIRDLNKMDTGENEFDDILENLKNLDLDSDDYEQLLNVIDEDAIYDFVANKGYVYVKIENMLDQEKLEEF